VPAPRRDQVCCRPCGWLLPRGDSPQDAAAATRKRRNEGWVIRARRRNGTRPTPLRGARHVEFLLAVSTKPCTQSTGQSDLRVRGFVLSGVRVQPGLYVMRS
jgi:hypothetical protein